jgi:predicted PurR-regulated permease PerM
MLYIGQYIILPIIEATLFAILLNPSVNFFMQKGLNRVGATILSMLIAIGLITLLVTMLSRQASLFSASFPILIDKFYILINQSVNDFSIRFNVSADAINSYLIKTKLELLNHTSDYIGSTLSTVGSTLFSTLLVIVYCLMILLYQPHLLDFIHKLSGEIHSIKVNELLLSTKSLIQSYLIGLLIEAAIVAVLYATGLLIIGIEYAIVLGILGALLNVIPYLGGLIAASIYMLVAFTTKDSSSYVIWVLLLFIIVHVIDNSFIIPKVVASKVKINPLVAITSIIASDSLWGVPGMFLAIPLTGVLKLVFDRIDLLNPWGFLLGDPAKDTIKISFRKKKRQS